MQAKRRLSHAQGYLGLGMVAEAAAELDLIPAPEKYTTEVLAVRLAILQEQKDWPALREAAAKFVGQLPDEAGGWITWAYATRRADSLAAAEAILLDAEKRHPREPTIQFNLGCYACQRGDLITARLRVDRAIALDADFATMAAFDPDLAPLRKSSSDLDCPPAP
jgi:predicted Zn-dependent protease